MKENKIETIDRLLLVLDNLKCSDLSSVAFDGDGLNYEQIISEGYYTQDYGHEKGEGCKKCGLLRLTRWRVRSNRDTWYSMCGTEFEYEVCSRCKIIISKEEIAAT